MHYVERESECGSGEVSEYESGNGKVENSQKSLKYNKSIVMPFPGNGAKNLTQQKYDTFKYLQV